MKTRKTILIVDDNDDDIELLTHALRKAAFDGTVLSAKTLDRASRILVSHPVQLLMLDVYIGHEDGVEFLAEIRSGGILPGLKIVVLSGLGRSIDQVTAHSLEADHFLVKPATPESLSPILALLWPSSLRAVPKVSG